MVAVQVELVLEEVVRGDILQALWVLCLPKTIRLSLVEVVLVQLVIVGLLKVLIHLLLQLLRRAAVKGLVLRVDLVLVLLVGAVDEVAVEHGITLLVVLVMLVLLDRVMMVVLVALKLALTQQVAEVEHQKVEPLVLRHFRVLVLEEMVYLHQSQVLLL